MVGIRKDFGLAGVSALVALALIPACLLWAGSARADVYCVPSSGPGCTSGYSGLQAALDAAAAHPTSDTVKVGAGTFTGPGSGPGGFAYLGSGQSNSDTITGSALGVTVIRPGNTSGDQTVLQLTTDSSLLIRNLLIELPANTGGDDIGIEVTGTAALQSVDVTGTETSDSTGIRCDQCSVSASRVDLPADFGSNTTGIETIGDAIIDTTRVRARVGVTNAGSDGVASMSQTRVQAFRGVTSAGGGIGILNSLINLPAEDGATGVALTDDLPELELPGASLQGVSIVGQGGNDSIGVLVSVDQAASEAEIAADSSVITGVERPFKLIAEGGASISSSPTYSAYDASSIVIATDSGGSVGFQSGTGTIDNLANPGFVDAAAGDFTPAEGSPLVDTGNPASPYLRSINPPLAAPWQETVDVLNNHRACQGTLSGPIRRDIGGIERKVDYADDCRAPTTSIVAKPRGTTTNRTPTFEVSSDENPAIFLCQWDGGEETQCGANRFEAPDLGLGSHTLRVRALDQFWNVDPIGVTVTYRVVPVSYLPTPRVLPLKVPSRTATSSVVAKFAANVSGARFRCRLNKGKWKSCKSPWKTPKLKKGKNTISLQAIDKAGNKSKVVKRKIIRTG